MSNPAEGKRPQVWKKTRIMPGLFRRFAAALIGNGACPRIESFALGYGWYDQSLDEPLLGIPDDITSIPGMFYEGTPQREVSGEMALFKCVIPSGSVTQATPCTVIGLYDQTGELVAVAHFLLEWITPDKDSEQHCYITFPELEEVTA